MVVVVFGFFYLLKTRLHYRKHLCLEAPRSALERPWGAAEVLLFADQDGGPNEPKVYPTVGQHQRLASSDELAQKNLEKVDKLPAARPSDQESTWQSVHLQKPHRAKGIAQDVMSAEKLGTGRCAPIRLNKQQSPSKPGYEKERCLLQTRLLPQSRARPSFLPYYSVF